MAELFQTPLRAAALGVLIVAGFVLARGLVTGRRYRTPVMALMILAVTMVLISEALQ